MKLVGRGDLKITKQQVAGGIASTQKTGDPAEVSAHEGKCGPNMSQRRSQSKGHSGIVVKVRQGDDDHGGEAWDA